MDCSLVMRPKAQKISNNSVSKFLFLSYFSQVVLLEMKSISILHNNFVIPLTRISTWALTTILKYCYLESLHMTISFHEEILSSMKRFALKDIFCGVFLCWCKFWGFFIYMILLSRYCECHCGDLKEGILGSRFTDQNTFVSLCSGWLTGKFMGMISMPYYEEVKNFTWLLSQC